MMRTRLMAVCVDVVLVIVFCAIGRRSHDEAVIAGLARTAWPFLTGLGAAWLTVTRRSPYTVVPGGLAAWLGAVIIGMLLRAVSGQGVAVSFIIVAATVLALFLLGWRLLVGRFTRA